MKRGKIFFIIGPTGAGKTVIVDYVLKNNPKIARAISYTTREKRPGEINGKDYFFITPKKFKELIKNKRFIEHTKVYGYLYGTTKDSFKKTEKGYNVIKIIDYQGAKKFKIQKIKAKYIFFAPKNIKILENRLKKRGDKDIKERLKTYKKELEFKKQCDYFIDTSGSIKESSKKLIKILKL